MLQTKNDNNWPYFFQQICKNVKLFTDDAIRWSKTKDNMSKSNNQIHRNELSQTRQSLKNQNKN